MAFLVPPLLFVAFVVVLWVKALENRQLNGATRRPEFQEKFQPSGPLQVVLLDSPDHSFDYVIRMLMDLLGYSGERALLAAKEVDRNGAGVIAVLERHEAEHLRDEIAAYGPDPLIQRCQQHKRN